MNRPLKRILSDWLIVTHHKSGSVWISLMSFVSECLLWLHAFH